MDRTADSLAAGTEPIELVKSCDTAAQGPSANEATSDLICHGLFVLFILFDHI